MFPIPFNFPFRKSNGAMTTIGDAISEGGGSYTLPTASESTKGGVKIGSGLSMSGEVLNATAELPAYSSATAGKVLTVDENGDLEWDTKGSGGGDAYVSYDFTKFGARSFYGVDYSSDGATFSSSGNGIINIFTSSNNVAYTQPNYRDITIFVDTGLLSMTSGTHRRFIMISEDNGFIYRSTGVWGLYLGSWYDSEITDPNYFDNCTIKIYIDSSKHWHIYKNGVLVFENSSGASTANALCIGSASNGLINSNIKAIRIYNGNYNE